MIIPCPACPARFTVSEADPDSTLSDLWDHLGGHTFDHRERSVLFTQAQERAR